MNSTDKAADRRLEAAAARIGAIAICHNMIEPVYKLHAEFSPEAGGVLLANIVVSLTSLFAKVNPHFTRALDITLQNKKGSSTDTIKAQMEEAVHRETETVEMVEVNGRAVTDQDKVKALKGLFAEIDKIVAEATAPEQKDKQPSAAVLRGIFDDIVNGKENSAR